MRHDGPCDGLRGSSGSSDAWMNLATGEVHGLK
jgi:hypothetical protein